jgi:hypothetical protein
MAINRVQSKTANSGAVAAGSLTLTLDAAPTPGNVIILVVSGFAATTNHLRVEAQTGITWTSFMVYGSNSTALLVAVGRVFAGAAAAISITASNTTGGIAAAAAEYSGTNLRIDRNTSAIGGSDTSPAAGPTGITSGDSALMIGAFSHRAASEVTYSAPTNSFGIVAQAQSSLGTTSGRSVALLERIVSVAGTASAGATTSLSGFWAASVLTLQEVVNGDSPGVTTLLSRLTAPRATNLDNLNAPITSRMATFTLPANFAALAIDGSGRVTVGSIVASVIELIAVAVEAHLLDDGDGQMLVNSIVGAIGNANVDEVALTAAITAALERTGGNLQTLVTRLTEERAAKLGLLFLDAYGKVHLADNALTASAISTTAVAELQSGLARQTDIPTDYQQRDVEVTLPSPPPAGYGVVSNVVLLAPPDDYCTCWTRTYDHAGLIKPRCEIVFEVTETSHNAYQGDRITRTSDDNGLLQVPLPIGVKYRYKFAPHFSSDKWSAFTVPAASQFQLPGLVS